MTPHALLCVLLEVSVATAQPARPNHAAFILTPIPVEKLSESERKDREAYLHEARGLARFLDRLWPYLVNDNGKPDQNLSLTALTAVAQFDSALCALNPEPTVGEALARVRVYQKWLKLIARDMDRARSNGVSTDKSEMMLYRFRLSIDRNYRPLFSRAV